MNTKDTPIDYKQLSIENAQDIAAREWNEAFDYRSLRNGVQCGNILMRHIDKVNKRAIEIYAEPLTLELQKQKEEIQRFELERTEMYHKYENQKELNAELVDTLKIARRELIEVNKKDMWEIEPTLFLIEDAIRNLESLIKKSSEI